MVKTQIQIPDPLYDEAKRVAKEREMSFAEVVRRGIEYIVERYPPNPDEEWSLPEPRDFGIRPGFDHGKLRDDIDEDRDSYLQHKAGLATPDEEKAP
jgi:hypothetical protein